MKLLIAIDGSPCSDAALSDLESAGLPEGAEAVVLSISEAWLPPASIHDILAPDHDPRWAPDLEPASEIAARACRRLSDRFPSWDVHAAVTRGSPASEILSRTEECLPDIVVVGSHGHSAFGRFTLGSVSHRVVAEAACSVRVGRVRPSASRAPRLVVGLDDSDDAQVAVDEVARRHWPTGTEVLVLTAFDAALERLPDFDQEMGRIDQLQWTAERRLREVGLGVTRTAVEGNPKHVLPERATSWDADCVFVGSRGLGRFKRMLLGSVAAAVAARAHCSVEVVRGSHR